MGDKITDYFPVVKSNSSSIEADKNGNNKRLLTRTDTELVDNGTTTTSTTSTLSIRQSSTSSSSQTITSPTQVKKKSKMDNDQNNNNNNNNESIDTTQLVDNFDLYETLEEQSETRSISLIGLKGEKYIDVWNTDYVKLPCSKNNVYRKDDKYLSKWYLICTVLMTPIRNSEELEQVIKTINPRCNWDFQGLHDFFETEYSETEANDFFTKTLPRIVNLALKLPFLCPRPIPLLSKSVDKELIFSQKQVACLLANAFLCTFPRQGSSSPNSSRFPVVNFHSLYSGAGVGYHRSPEEASAVRAAKLKCIIHYFKKTLDESVPIKNGSISFHRQVVSEEEVPDWEKSTTLLKNFTTMANGTIEENGLGMLQVDFANKMIGGGVLGHGCVQEEIRFLINPELIVARLFVAELQENESLIITGSEQFSKYSGYGSTFEWAGDFQDTTPFDSSNRRQTSIVAMDAIKFTGDPFLQFSPINVERELLKSFSGFYDRCSATLPPPVATGNWGCGVFRGDKHLKSIIQFMSASIAGREVVYHAFGEEEFANELAAMVVKLQTNGITVGQLYSSLWEYYKLMCQTKSNLGLFTYLDAHFG